MIIAIMLFCPGSGAAREGLPPGFPEALKPGGAGRVIDVRDGNSLTLADGRTVRLAGIQAPLTDPDGRGSDPWPLATDAAALLQSVVAHRRVTLGYGGRVTDRYGRRLAHLFLDDGTWVQGVMLLRGLARVRTTADNRALAAAMLAREDAARAARRGIWSLAWYAVRDPRETTADIASFQIVEGRIHAVGLGRREVYLNFADDWRRDFTVVLDRKSLGAFVRHLVPIDSVDGDPLTRIRTLAGRSIRVRGWITERNGPEIRPTHPEQIELLP